MITVNELVENNNLGLTFKAGRSAGKRMVTWAHAVDLPDPWHWISPGTLLMTTGGGLPSEPIEQVNWLRQLEQAKASAIVIAPKEFTPQLTQELLDEAVNLGLPILGASFELEFLRLARLVIESVLQAQKDRFDAGNKLFQVYNDALWESSKLEERLNILGQKLSINLQIIDYETLTPIFPFSSPVAENEVPYSLKIPGRTQTALNIINKNSRFFNDSFLSPILAGLLSIELERGMIDRDGFRQAGETLFHDLLNGEIDYGAAKTMLERRGLSGQLVTVAIESTNQGLRQYNDIHHIPDFYDIYPLFHDDGKKLFAVLPNDQKLLDTLNRYLGANTKIGVSSPITAMIGFKESVFQASLALTRIKEGQTDIIHYNHLDLELSLGPKTVAEARSIVGHYFGPLIEYEQTNTLPLLKTLAIFLKYDGNWKITASKLDIHRQTLVYRLKVIEELTGIKPTTSLGITRFCIALEAAKTIGILKDY
ncbi:PucR family transcriptional regulator ligand-binding domain-containing protein [Acinetobacter sp. ME22]|uniref:PucR family transcriptional regulator n=1 Tax=Acinetobacter sp. ME22 TaxID=2904802 RepID=UPI001EDAAA95|nr:PucR family transcriptional regulator ligand-binding domain-containing protein [Acinetobacter sp. ME22]MCG2575110.1 PucR family transcriptional regulator ligand-binding domain-containing protein [Acinetobacter sp. ME22]